MRTVALVWPIPFILLIGGRRALFLPTFVRQPKRALGVVLVIASGLASLTFSRHLALSVQMLLATLVAMLICASFWGILDCEDPSPLRIFALVSIAVCLTALVRFPAFAAGRLTFGFDANSLGLILLSVAIASLALRRLPVRFAVALAALYLMYLTDSRSAMIGTAIALIAYFSMRRRALMAWSMVAILLLSITMVAMKSQDLTTATDEVSQALQLHNHDRGIGSGFTGRTEIWQESIEIWQEHPLIGSGYRAIDDLVENGSTHNGYLSILAETGIFGMLSTGLFFSQGVRGLIIDAGRGSQVAQLGLALTAGYLFVAIFERYFLNFGNPTSLLVLSMWLRPMVTPWPRRTNGRNEIASRRTPITPAGVYAYPYSRDNLHSFPFSKT